MKLECTHCSPWRGPQRNHFASIDDAIIHLVSSHPSGLLKFIQHLTSAHYSSVAEMLVADALRGRFAEGQHETR